MIDMLVVDHAGGAVRRRRFRSRSPAEMGFTLIELLIVIAVLGILAGIVLFAVGRATSDSQASACAADRKTLTRVSCRV